MTIALAQATYNPDDVKPGWVALVLVLVLAVATYFLWRSMNTQLRRIDVPTRAEVRQAGDDRSTAEARPGRDAISPGAPDDGP